MCNQFFRPRATGRIEFSARFVAPLALQNKRVIYNLLFHASAATLLQIARDPRHLGAKIGFFSVLHTWDQRLQHHPHVHCVLAAGGLAPDHSRWISSRRSFFLPVQVLGRVFRGKFVAGLKTAFHAGALQFHGHLLPLAEPRAFASWLRVLFRHDWRVYATRPFGGAQPRPALLRRGYFSATTGSATPSALSAGQNTRCAISVPTPTALPFPTAGWLLSPRATELFAGAPPLTATRSG